MRPKDLWIIGAVLVGAYVIMRGAPGMTFPGLTRVALPQPRAVVQDPATGEVRETELPWTVVPGYSYTTPPGDPFLRGEVYGPYFCQGLTGPEYDNCVQAVGGFS